jgi:hypothetical protein
MNVDLSGSKALVSAGIFLRDPTYLTLKQAIPEGEARPRDRTGARRFGGTWTCTRTCSSTVI